MDTVVVYSANNSPRLEFVLGWLLRERLQLGYRIVNTLQEAAAHDAIIYYGTAPSGKLSIPSAGLLEQKGVAKSNPATGTWGTIPTIYSCEDKQYSLPFDLFSAIFFLLSRYEEYEAFTPDKHGRYPATNSLLYKNGWLQRPLADEWVYAFRTELRKQLKIDVPELQFLFRPTYDIDMAYSHLHKGIGRIAGAYLRALLLVDLKQIDQRTKVLKKKQKDPYDSFRWLRQLHKEYGFNPTYFILSANRTTRFDKNIHPQHPAMVRVIKNLSKEGSIGIHPSYYSGQGDVMRQEKTMLEAVAGHSTTISRQHYIRAVMPHTYRMLLRNHISEDYTMGYGTHLGFRAGTGCSFLWYDIEHETVTTLRIHPFCFMDTTAHYEAKLTTHQSFERLEAMCKLLQQTGSTLVTVFHNFSLGTDDEWKGWRQAYELFMHSRVKSRA